MGRSEAAGPGPDDQSELEQIARRERLLGVGLKIASAALVAALAFLLFSYIAARVGPPRSAYEFQLERVRFWEAIVRDEPRSSLNRTNLALAYLKIGNDTKAIAEFKKAIKNNPRDYNPYLLLGRHYLDNGHLDEAAPLLENAAKYAPGPPRAFALFKLGEIYEEKEDDEKALDFYIRASQEEPLMWNAHYKIGTLYEKDGKKDLALAEYEEAAKFNPENQRVQKAIERLSR